MAKDAVNKVIAAEADAAKCIAEAREKANKLISDAEREGKESLLRAEDEAEREVKKLLSDAESGAENASRDILKNTEQESEKLEALALGRMDKAASVIAERVVKG